MIKYTAPVAGIDCVSCRERNIFKISKSQFVKLLGTCENCCVECDDPVYYEWSVEDEQGRKFPLDETTTTTGNNRSSLVISRYSFNDNHNYTFRLEIHTKSRQFDTHGDSSLILYASNPPSGGVCKWIAGEEPIIALETMLHVTCTDWEDNSGSSSPLSYHTYVEHPSDLSTWYSIYIGTSVDIYFKISAFEGANDVGKIILSTKVIDQEQNEVVGFRE